MSGIFGATTLPTAGVASATPAGGSGIFAPQLQSSLQTQPSGSGGGGGFLGSLQNWNPLGLRTFATGLVGGLAHSVGGALEDVGQGIGAGIGAAADLATGNTRAASRMAGQGVGSFEDLGRRVGDFGVGLVTNLEPLVTTASLIGGTPTERALQEDVFQPFNKWLGSGPIHNILTPENADYLYNQGQGMRPEDWIATAKSKGIGYAGLSAVGQVAEVGGIAVSAAGVLASRAADAATAASESMDAGAAEQAATQTAKSQAIQDFIQKMNPIAHPYRFVGEKTADLLGTMHDAAFPPTVSQTVSTAGTTLDTATSFSPFHPATKVTPEDQAAAQSAMIPNDLLQLVRGSMHPQDSAAEAMAGSDAAAYSVHPDVQAAVQEAAQAAVEHPYVEPPVPAGMTRLYRVGLPGGEWYTEGAPNAARATGTAVEDLGRVSHVDVPDSVAASLPRGPNGEINLGGHPELMSQAVEHLPTTTFEGKTEPAVKVTQAPPASVQEEPAKYGVGGKRFNNVEGTPLTPGEKAAGEEALHGVSARARAAEEAGLPLYMFDHLGQRIQLESPAWAKRIAQALPDSVNRVIGSIGYNAITKIRFRALYQNAMHVMESAQAVAQMSPAMMEAKNAALRILSPYVGRDVATDAIGQEIHARLNGEQLIAEFKGSHPGMLTDLRAAQFKAAVRGRFPGVTDEMLARMPEDARAAFQQSLNAATELFKEEAAKAKETLLATRFGAKSLEAAILGPNEVPMSAEQVRLYRRAERDYEYAAKARAKVPGEQERIAGQTAQADKTGARAHSFVDDLRNKLGFKVQTAQDLYKGVPPGMRDQGASVAQLGVATVANEGGALLDIGTGEVLHPTSGVAVPIAQQFDIPVADWAAQGEAAIRNAVMNPVADDSSVYEPQALWGGADAKLSVNIVTGDDGTQHVVGNISMHTVNGKPMQEWQAYVIGGAHHAGAGLDFTTGHAVQMTLDPNEQVLLQHYEGQARDSSSGLSRWATQRSQEAARPETGITADQLHAEMMANLWLDHIFASRNASFHTGDIFNTDLAFRGTEPRPAVAVPPDGQAVNAALIGQRRWGTLQAQATEAHNVIDAIRSALSQGRSVSVHNFAPLDDFFREEIDAARRSGNAAQLTGIMGKYDQWLGVQDRIAGALERNDFEAAHGLMDSYLARNKDYYLNEPTAPSGLYDLSAVEVDSTIGHLTRGATLENPSNLGRILMRLYASGDVTTLLEQDLHAIRMHAPGDEMAALSEAYPHLQDATLTPARLADERRFAVDFMQHLRTRGAVAGPLHDLYMAISDTMAQHYGPALATETGQAIPMEMVNWLDGIFNPDIQAPVAHDDPLRAQYIPENKGVNPQQLRGETDAAYAQRVRQYGEARGQATVLQQRVRDAEAQAYRADKFANQMHGMMLEPTHSELVATQLEARASDTLNKLADQLQNVTGKDVPQQWRPYMEAIDAIRAEAAKDPSMQPLLDEIPKNFAQAMQYAAERGFEPTYMPDLTWDQAQKYLYGHLELGGTAEEASMRKENTGVVRGQGGQETLQNRSLESLGAGTVIAMKEQLQSTLMQFVEEHYARLLPPRTPIPEGWMPWSPTRDAIITGRTLDDKAIMSANTDKIVPSAVYDSLKSFQNPHLNMPFRFLFKGGATAVWKHLLLTFSPTWYVKHFIGAVTLATLEGASFRDWQTAIRQWKTDTLPAAVLKKTIYDTVDSMQGRQGSMIRLSNAHGPIEQATRGLRAIAGLPERAQEEGLRALEPTLVRAEGYKAMSHQITQSMRDVVKTVDSLGRAAVYARTLRKTGDASFAAYRAWEALGDFGKLGPIEREMVTSIIPFWAFQKAMFRILRRLPADHPVVTGALMQLGQMQQAYLQKQLGGNIPDAYVAADMVGGHFTQLDKLNPLIDSWKVATPDGIAASINPFLQILGQYAFHSPAYNARPGMLPNGQLAPTPDLWQSLVGTFTSAVPGIGNPAALNLTSAMSQAQLDALYKRLAKVQQAQQVVGSGGFLTEDTVAKTGTGPNATYTTPPKAPLAPAGASTFGVAPVAQPKAGAATGGLFGAKASTTGSGVFGNGTKAGKIRSQRRGVRSHVVESFRIRAPRPHVAGVHAFRIRTPRAPRARTGNVRMPKLSSSLSHHTHHLGGFRSFG